MPSCQFTACIAIVDSPSQLLFRRLPGARAPGKRPLADAIFRQRFMSLNIRRLAHWRIYECDAFDRKMDLGIIDDPLRGLSDDHSAPGNVCNVCRPDVSSHDLADNGAQ